MNKEQFIDFKIFSSKINSIIKIDFLFISKDYLYARDCLANFYFQCLFEDKSDIYNKKIVRGDDYRIIKSDFNWSSFIEKQKGNKEYEFFKLEKSDTGISTLIVPECDQSKFSLTYIDELDLVILEILKAEKTIANYLMHWKNISIQMNCLKSLLNSKS